MIQFEIHGRKVNMYESHADRLVKVLNEGTDQSWSVSDVVSRASKQLSAEERKAREAKHAQASAEREHAKAVQLAKDQEAYKKELQEKLDAIKDVDVDSAAEAAAKKAKDAKEAAVRVAEAKAETLVSEARGGIIGGIHHAVKSALN